MQASNASGSPGEHLIGDSFTEYHLPALQSNPLQQEGNSDRSNHAKPAAPSSVVATLLSPMHPPFLMQDLSSLFAGGVPGGFSLIRPAEHLRSSAGVETNINAVKLARWWETRAVDQARVQSLQDAERAQEPLSRPAADQLSPDCSQSSREGLAVVAWLVHELCLARGQNVMCVTNVIKCPRENPCVAMALHRLYLLDSTQNTLRRGCCITARATSSPSSPFAWNSISMLCGSLSISWGCLFWYSARISQSSCSSSDLPLVPLSPLTRRRSAS